MPCKVLLLAHPPPFRTALPLLPCTPAACTSHPQQGTSFRLRAPAQGRPTLLPRAAHRMPAPPAAQPRVARGMFWNYLSLGLDAEAAYSFHTLREQHAWAASNRVANQAWYSWFSCTSGWFCGAQVGGGAPGRQVHEHSPAVLAACTPLCR